MGDHRAAFAAAIEEWVSPACPRREIVNAIFYILRRGIPWRMVPPCFPPRQTVDGWFATWRDGGVWQRITHHLIIQDRERLGREASPTAAAIDSQSVEITEADGPHGYDAGKKVLGRKRHAMVDTDGRPLVLRVHQVAVQDRDGAVPLLKASRCRFPFVERAFADSAYAARWVAKATCIAIEIARKPPGQIGSAVHPRRWIIERCCAWYGRNRRLAKDLEATIASAAAFVYVASAMLLVRRLDRCT